MTCLLSKSIILRPSSHETTAVLSLTITGEETGWDFPRLIIVGFPPFSQREYGIITSL